MPRTAETPSRGRPGSAPGLLDVPYPTLDPTYPDLAGLAAVHSRMMRNYFRLARAHEELSRRRRSPRGRSAGSWLAEQLELERARLGRELHAGAGQALAGIKIHLEIIDSLLESPSDAVRASLHRIGLLAQDALQQLRAISHRVHPPDWQRLRLEDAVKTLWDLTGIPLRFQAELDIAPLAKEPPHAVRTTVYRTAQEALANVVRHAGASRVALRLAPVNGNLCLTVEDDGKGFDPVRLLDGPEIPAGIGLRSMRDQVRRLLGDFEIDSGPGGTRLSVSLPLHENS
jgi:two-component system NarL family sensor kinase